MEDFYWAVGLGYWVADFAWFEVGCFGGYVAGYGFAIVLGMGTFLPFAATVNFFFCTAGGAALAA